MVFNQEWNQCNYFRIWVELKIIILSKISYYQHGKDGSVSKMPPLSIRGCNPCTHIKGKVQQYTPANLKLQKQSWEMAHWPVNEVESVSCRFSEYLGLKNRNLKIQTAIENTQYQRCIHM